MSRVEFSSRVKSLVQLLQSAFNVAYGFILLFMAALALFLGFILWHIYRPLIALLLFATALPFFYVHSKKELADDILKEVDLAVSRPRSSGTDEETNAEASEDQNSFLHRMIYKAIDAAFGAVVDSFIIVPAIIAFFGVILLSVGFYRFGISILVVSSFIVLIVGCCCISFKKIAYMFVDGWLKQPSGNETAPLLP